MTERVVVAVEQLRRRVPGGIGRYARGLLDGLREIGRPPVELVASRHRGGVADPLSAWGFPLRTSALPAPFLVAAWDRGLAPVRSARLVHSVSLASPPVRPRRSRGGPALVVTVHDLAWRTHPGTSTSRGLRWHEAALGRALERADAFVVPSGPVADALGAAGADRRRVQVIPHGVDHLPKPDHAGAASLLRRLGVTEGYLLAAATLEPRKNLRRLIAAFARARPSLAGPWQLVVVGPPGWGDAGVGRVEGVVAAGAVGDAVLAGLYASARAFAYVPLAEGFGLPPLEAMACGVPVVASVTVPSVTVPSVTVPSVTLPSVTVPSVTVPDVAASAGAQGQPEGARTVALLVDPTTLDEIAGALVLASGDDALRGALVANGRMHAAPFRWRTSAEAHVAWWESVT